MQANIERLSKKMDSFINTTVDIRELKEYTIRLSQIQILHWELKQQYEKTKRTYGKDLAKETTRILDAWEEKSKNKAELKAQDKYELQGDEVMELKGTNTKLDQVIKAHDKVMQICKIEIQDATKHWAMEQDFTQSPF